MSFSELAAERGLTASSRVLLLEQGTAEIDGASTLRIAPGAPVLVLRRLRLLDGIPTLLQESTLPLGRLPGLEEVTAQEFAARSLYRIIEEICGMTPMRADFTVEARPNDPELAGLLATAVDRPLLWTIQTTYDLKGQPIEHGWSAYPHDRYRFRASLVRAPVIAMSADEENQL
ncbi:MAG: GntR family transcriptional regulator [Deltaproteobacteria bacterium]